MKRNLKLILIAVVAAFMALTACSKNESGNSGSATNNNTNSSSSSAPASSKAPEKPIEISFWYEPGGPAGELMEKLSKEFNESQQRIVVTPSFVDPGSFTTKATAAIVAKNPPDTALVIHQHVPMFKQSLVPVEEMMNNDASFDRSQFYDSMWDMMTLDGKIYSLPYETTNLGIVYNKAMFDKAGVKEPTTWEELRTVAKQLTNPAEKEFGMTIWIGGNDPFGFQPFIWQNGGDFMTPDHKDVLFEQPETIEAIQFFYDMIHVDKSIPLAPPENGFLSGKVGMSWSGPWEVPAFKQNATFEWGMMPLPAGKTKATNVGGTTLAMFKSNPEREQAAWEFLKFLTSKESAIALFELGWLPIRKDAEQSPEWAAQLDQYPQLKVYTEQMQYGKMRPFGDHYNEVSQAFMEGWNAAIYGNVTPAEGMRTAAEKARNILAGN